MQPTVAKSHWGSPQHPCPLKDTLQGSLAPLSYLKSTFVSTQTERNNLHPQWMTYETFSASGETKIASCSHTQYFCYPRHNQRGHLLYLLKITYITVLRIKFVQFLWYAISQRLLFCVRNPNIKKQIALCQCTGIANMQLHLCLGWPVLGGIDIGQGGV